MANRNTELHFSKLPNVDIKRSIFDLSHGHKTTFNEGELVPILVQEILPGDTFNIDTGYVIRMNTPLKPVMDTAYLDLYYFFVPNRLVWDHWPEFMGENKTEAWDEEQTEYEIPTISGIFNNGSIADHMGAPTEIKIGRSSTADAINGTIIKGINALPFRDYVLIYNEWFRNQNLIAPIDTEKDLDGNQTNDTSVSYGKNVPSRGGTKCLKVAKLHDYFTSALPEPQKGNPVTIPLGDNAPVVGNGTAIGLTTGKNSMGVNDSLFNLYANPTPNGKNPTTINQQIDLLVPGIEKVNNETNELSTDSAKIGEIATDLDYLTNVRTPYPVGLTTNANNSGMIADLTNATAININDIRLAFAVQRQLEKDARGGTRYIEIIKSNFGVTSADARQQRPEYLGGKRCPINMMQVLQTSEGTENSPQGNTAAFSNTAGSNRSFTKSFTEHGFIIGLACIRVVNSYQQGLNKMWSRSRRFDYYWPALANIGEQPILNKEIYMQDTPASAAGDENDQNEQVFGYQEAWAEYRYNPNLITGQLRSNAEKNGNIWHYGLSFDQLPTLSQEFNDEGTEAIDQTLSVQSSVSDQFTCDFYFSIKAARPMPMYSIPGLIDHN